VTLSTYHQRHIEVWLWETRFDCRYSIYGNQLVTTGAEGASLNHTYRSLRSLETWGVCGIRRVLDGDGVGVFSFESELAAGLA
jgi:hypothetical protein